MKSSTLPAERPSRRCCSCLPKKSPARSIRAKLREPSPGMVNSRGFVPLSNRKLRVSKPRLRHKEQGEVEVPAYRALHTNSTLAARMLDILLRGVSTRQYQQVLPEMAQTVGVSKSSVSREAIAASE